MVASAEQPPAEDAFTASEHEQGDADALWRRLVQGDRRALGRAISLCESTRADHRRIAEELTARALAEERVTKTARIGVTGPAGVGKSTLLDVLGCFLLDQGLRPAVLAIDPSSRRTGGSLLGDQTRMGAFVRRGGFVRPSPTRGYLGGAGAHTLEACLLCAAAGFSPVFVETVGVGQNETEVSDLVDVVVLLLQPGAGDELQGLKRGVLEHADLLVVAQADGERLPLAEDTRGRFQAALRLLRPEVPAVGLVSARENRGIQELWQALAALLDARRASGQWAERRRDQRVRWFRRLLVSGLVEALESREPFGQRIAELERAVADGRTSAAAAVRTVLDSLWKSSPAKG